MKIILGSRGSDLALAQSRFIKKLIEGLDSNNQVEIQIIKTSGDRIQNVPLSAVGETADERKGFFTKELEDALLEKKVDLAVHSYKDMPTAEIPGLTIVAVPERVSNKDLLLFPTEKRISDNPPYIKAGSRIGTSSVRRISQLQHLWPEMECVGLRGNVPTRIKKLVSGKTQSLDSSEQEEKIDAIMLAEAGLNRLRAVGLFDEGGEYSGLLEGFEMQPIPSELFIPAPAQGALAIQCRSDDAKIYDLLRRLHKTEEAEGVDSERLVLQHLEGGCHLPLGADCKKSDDNLYELSIYLGKEAANNRRGKSYFFSRRGKDSQKLANYVIEEIKEKLPIVLTGREDRIQELVNTFSGEPLISVPLIRIDSISPTAEQIDNLRKIISQMRSPNGKRNLISVFSTPGVNSFKKLLDSENISLPSEIEWAITGEKTEETLLNEFPGARIAYKSPDGTGETLARLILKDKENIKPVIISISAEKGRPEFCEILKQSSMQPEQFILYQSIKTEIEPSDLKKIPNRCYIAFGSPSAVRIFFEMNQDLNTDGHRYCAIGPTTEQELRKLNKDVYMVSPSPDYEALLKELL